MSGGGAPRGFAAPAGTIDDMVRSPAMNASRNVSDKPVPAAPPTALLER
jgi:hypothetical protein